MTREPEGRLSLPLAGRVAIVTGGGRGIGAEIARGFAAAGAAVAVTARTASQVQAVAAGIEAAGGRVLAIAADVTSQADVERLVAETEAALGHVDVLGNNAGAQERGARLWEAEPEDWQHTIAVNVCGPFLLSRAVLPGMVERGRGRIINVSSGASIMPGGFTGFSAYGASKAALNRITKHWQPRSKSAASASSPSIPASCAPRCSAATSNRIWRR